LIATASPGSVLLDIDSERRVMIFHAIDASDPDGFREEMSRFYRRFQRGAVP
jgi:multisubunit Na+/H+ antiporter MnhE subunit